jgi:hypothetical protein
MIRGGSALVALTLALPGTGAAAMDRTIMVFGGAATLNDWLEVVAVTPIESAETGLIGIAPGLSWDLPDPRFKFSVEVQVVKYLGYQQSWEFNVVPAMIRWFPKEQPGLESVGFGLGYSFASEPPVNEARRGNDGVTTQEKWYWTLELGFETARPDRDVVLRLHHRSTGAGTMGEGKSTNALVIGIRQIF